MQLVPRRTAAPAEEVVKLKDMKAHLRLDPNVDDDDSLVGGMIASATSHLDGYRGILGRCILDQGWEVDLPNAGTFRLPLPDVTSATASSGVVEICHDPLGSLAAVSEAATVSFRARMPDEALDAVRMAMKLIVGHWYVHREEISLGQAPAEIPMSAGALIAPLRWVRI